MRVEQSPEKKDRDRVSKGLAVAPRGGRLCLQERNRAAPVMGEDNAAAHVAPSAEL